MKIDINKKYRTKDGREVTLLHRAPDGWPGKYPWRGVVGNEPFSWTDEGIFMSCAGESECDIVEIREPREWELVVASSENRTYKTGTIDEKATADLQAGDRSVPPGPWEIVRVRQIID